MIRDTSVSLESRRVQFSSYFPPAPTLSLPDADAEGLDQELFLPEMLLILHTGLSYESGLYSLFFISVSAYWDRDIASAALRFRGKVGYP